MHYSSVRSNAKRFIFYCHNLEVGRVPQHCAARTHCGSHLSHNLQMVMRAVCSISIVALARASLFIMNVPGMSRHFMHNSKVLYLSHKKPKLERRLLFSTIQASCNCWVRTCTILSTTRTSILGQTPMAQQPFKRSWSWLCSLLILARFVDGEDVPWCAPIPGRSYGNQVLLVATQPPIQQPFSLGCLRSRA